MKKSLIPMKAEEFALKIFNELKSHARFRNLPQARKIDVFTSVGLKVLTFYQACQELGAPIQANFSSLVIEALDIALHFPAGVLSEGETRSSNNFDRRDYSNTYLTPKD